MSAKRLARIAERIGRVSPVAARTTAALEAVGTRARGLARRARESYWTQRARLRRNQLHDTVFVGITGSAGKTMTKFLAGAVLSSSKRGRHAKGSLNTLTGVARNLLKYARAGDEFHIVEMSAGTPGAIARQLDIVRPSIGILTAIGTDHYTAYGTVEALAAEKGKLIEALPPDGLAILNADDPRVLALRAKCRCRVVTYGVNADADLRATDVQSAWPKRLSMTVHHRGLAVHCQTQLVGTQWTAAVLAALATGVAFGLSLDAAAQALAEVEPNNGRMSPHVLPNGITFIRDDWKASTYTLAPAFEALRAAEAPRTFAVVGTLSDIQGTAGRRYVAAARSALEVADYVYFVGPQASMALPAQPKDRPDRLRVFSTARAADESLRATLQAGDVVLVKASNADHLERLVLSHQQDVGCWRTGCGRSLFCMQCNELGRMPARQAPSVPNDLPEVGRPQSSMPAAAFGPDDMPCFVVGLGNPGESRHNTPHNVGYRIVEQLAAELGASWSEEDAGAVARASVNERAIWLLKLRTPINLTGGHLASLSRELGFSAEHCILAHDDLSLPLGSVRLRMNGSDGGHRGVRSAIEAFQSNAFRRIKVGVARSDDRGPAHDVVLAPFDAAETAVIDRAVHDAAHRVRELLQREHAARQRQAAAASRPTQ